MDLKDLAYFKINVKCKFIRKKNGFKGMNDRRTSRYYIKNHVKIVAKIIVIYSNVASIERLGTRNLLASPFSHKRKRRKNKKHRHYLVWD